MALIDEIAAGLENEMVRLKTEWEKVFDADMAHYRSLLSRVETLRDMRHTASYLPLRDQEKEGYVTVMRTLPEMLRELGGKEIDKAQVFVDLLKKLFGPI